MNYELKEIQIEDIIGPCECEDQEGWRDNSFGLRGYRDITTRYWCARCIKTLLDVHRCYTGDTP